MKLPVSIYVLLRPNTKLLIGPDWFKNSIFPKPEAWAKTAMKSLDENRINADVDGYPMLRIGYA